MSFFAYFAVLLVAAASAIFGLDLLTSPLPPAEKPKTQIASAPPPSAVAKQEAAREAANKPANDSSLTPVYPRPAADNNVRMVYPPTNEIPITGRAAPETTGSGGGDDTKQAAQPTQTAQPAPAQQPQPAPAQPVQQAAQPLQTPQAQPTQQPQVQQAMQTTTQPPQQQPAMAAQASGPQCDVSACVAAYRSFNAADCTYQSFGGGRRVCDKGATGSTQTAQSAPVSRPQPTETRRERVARQPRGNDDSRLQDAVRRVKELTARAQADDNDNSFTSAPVGGSRRVIVIERGREDFWR